MPDDIFALGFSVDNKQATRGIVEIANGLFALEGNYNKVKNLFEQGFALRTDGSVNQFSQLVKGMSESSTGIKSLSGAFKSIANILPKLSGENFMPVNSAALDKMTEFSLAGTAAGESIKNIVGREFVSQMALARKEIGKLNSSLLHVAKSGRAAKEALTGIPGMLNKLSGEKIKVISPDAIESMRQYGNEVRAAADEIKNLQGFTGQIRKSSRSVSDFQIASSGATSSVRSLGSELLSIATTSSLPMFFRNAAKEAVNFGAELAQIESLTLNFSADKLRQGLLALPSAFGDARKNANALYYAYSSGVEGTEKDLIDFTSQVSKLSQIIRANQTDTVNAVTTAFNAYNLSVKDAAEVSDLFYAIVKRGRAEGNELATGLGQVIPTAATAGLTLNEMGASITSLTKVMNTRNAITYFNNALSKLIKPTKESRLAAKELGIELGLDALRAKGFSAMMQELREKTLGNQQALLKIFPDLRGQRAALQLLNKGWGDFQNQLAFFEKKAGVADLAFEKLNESIEYQLSILPQTFGKIKIAAGEVMTGILTLGGALEPVLRAFNNMTPAAQRAVGALTLMGAVYGLLKAKTFLFTTVQKSEIRHQQLLAALRGKEIAQRSAVTAAVNAETAAKARLAKMGRYFSFGFNSSKGSSAKNFKSSWGSTIKWSGATTEILSMRKGVFVLGKALGGLVKVITSLFTPLNVLIAGAATAAVFAVDFLSSKGDTFYEKLENTRVISKIADAIYDFFTGAITEAKRLSKFLDDKRDAKLYAQNLRDIAKVVSAPFAIAADNVDSFKTQFETLNQNTKRAFDALNSAKMSDMIREYNKVTGEIERFADIPAKFNLAEAVKRANEKYGSRLPSGEKDLHAVKRGLGVQGGLYSSEDLRRIDALKYIEEERKIFKEKQKSYDDLRKRAEELSGKITPALEAYRRAGESEVAFWARQKSLILGITGLIEEQRFAMMKPAEQMKKQAEYIANYKKEYEHALQENNGEAASRAMKNILSTYSSMLKKLDYSIKDLKNLAETLGKDSFDALLKSFDTPAQKIKAINERAKTLFGESGVLWSGGKFSIPSLDNEKLESSYAKAKSAIELQIMAVQEDINSKKSLAEAEKQANSKTLELIRSFGKFSSTASEAVDAFSVDAVKLQSRRFAAVPKFEQRQTAQAGLQGAQSKLSELYAKMSQLAESFRQMADSRRQQTESQRNSLNAEFENYMTSVVESSQKAAKEQVKAINELIKQAEKIENKFSKVEESSRRTADNTGKTAKVVGNMNTVMIG